ncbi:MAG: lipopolysaccharide transport periplasmic protein LptA [Campylobacteraceae bacterium]|nr:lipopolysaccharide transport periplasmic protein LptA [Campylobacteraceae bacterium]
MRVIFIVILLSVNCIFAAQVEVKADKFRASEVEQQGVFTGNVIVTKGEDILKSDRLVIYFDKNKNPLKYEATGSASVKMTMNDLHYYGEGKVLTYEPEETRYTIRENGFLHEVENDRKVYGDLIVVNQTKGTYEVDSKPSKPVKFIFQVEEDSEPSPELIK